MKIKLDQRQQIVFLWLAAMKSGSLHPTNYHSVGSGISALLDAVAFNKEDRLKRTRAEPHRLRENKQQGFTLRQEEVQWAELLAHRMGGVSAQHAIQRFANEVIALAPLIDEILLESEIKAAITATLSIWTGATNA
jgi:hypothetical protein